MIDPTKAGSEIKDGKYEATVTISDNGGHKTSSSRAFVIDNTPPVVVLQRPASSKAETDSNKIVKRKSIDNKPMSEEEAILQMNLLGHEFFVFENVDTHATSVLYKRKDGNYGIIDIK